jgi:hypothetical protein
MLSSVPFVTNKANLENWPAGASCTNKPNSRQMGRQDHRQGLWP